MTLILINNIIYFLNKHLVGKVSYYLTIGLFVGELDNGGVQFQLSGDGGTTRVTCFTKDNTIKYSDFVFIT